MKKHAEQCKICATKGIFALSVCHTCLKIIGTIDRCFWMCDVCKSLGILKKRKEFHIWICSQCWDEDRGAIEEEEEE